MSFDDELALWHAATRNGKHRKQKSGLTKPLMAVTCRRQGLVQSSSDVVQTLQNVQGIELPDEQLTSSSPSIEPLAPFRFDASSQSPPVSGQFFPEEHLTHFNPRRLRTDMDVSPKLLLECNFEFRSEPALTNFGLWPFKLA